MDDLNMVSSFHELHVSQHPYLRNASLPIRRTIQNYINQSETNLSCRASDIGSQVSIDQNSPLQIAPGVFVEN